MSMIGLLHLLVISTSSSSIENWLSTLLSYAPGRDIGRHLHKALDFYLSLVKDQRPRSDDDKKNGLQIDVPRLTRERLLTEVRLVASSAPSSRGADSLPFPHPPFIILVLSVAQTIQERLGPPDRQDSSSAQSAARLTSSPPRRPRHRLGHPRLPFPTPSPSPPLRRHHHLAIQAALGNGSQSHRTTMTHSTSSSPPRQSLSCLAHPQRAPSHRR